MDLGSLTLLAVLTSSGAVGTAAMITGFIAMLKRLPRLGVIIDAEREPLVAFSLSAVVVLIAMGNAVVTGAATLTLEFGFASFLAWYAIAELSMAVHDTVRNRLPN